jgi:hypothetical protein
MRLPLDTASAGGLSHQYKVHSQLPSLGSKGTLTHLHFNLKLSPHANAAEPALSPTDNRTAPASDH